MNNSTSISLDVVTDIKFFVPTSTDSGEDIFASQVIPESVSQLFVKVGTLNDLTVTIPRLLAQHMAIVPSVACCCRIAKRMNE